MLVLKVRLVEVTGGGERILPGGGRSCRVDIGASGDDSVPFSTTGEYRNSCPAARVRGVIVPYPSVGITTKKSNHSPQSLTKENQVKAQTQKTT